MHTWHQLEIALFDHKITMGICLTLIILTLCLYKLAYCRSAGSTGISMSHDQDVASNYGNGCYFTILLPKHHRLLISDFSFREVNSLEDIPREYIYSYHNHMNEEILNPYYQKDLVVASPTIRRGCY